MTISRQSKGFVKTEWICPSCNSRNPGPEKTCENCGSPQPENVQFYLPAEAKIIQDENAAKAAKAGADIHCGFCGTRNPGTATVCSQCGADGIEDAIASKLEEVVNDARKKHHMVEVTTLSI